MPGLAGSVSSQKGCGLILATSTLKRRLKENMPSEIQHRVASPILSWTREIGAVFDKRGERHKPISREAPKCPDLLLLIGVYRSMTPLRIRP